jgi:hypothetical protein
MVAGAASPPILMTSERSILRLLGLSLQRDARGVARPVAVLGVPVRIKRGEVAAGRVIAAPLPPARPPLFSLQEVSR